MHSAVPSPLVAFAGWLCPGAGYFIIGQHTRGIVVGVAILALFIGGLLIGGMRVVDPAPPAAYIGAPREAILNRPWFIAQVLAGPVSIISANIGSSSGVATSHARLNDIGTLYAAVAGMLNLLSIIDATHRAARLEAKR